MNKDKLSNVLIVIGLCFMLGPIISLYITYPFVPGSTCMALMLYDLMTDSVFPLRMLDILFGFIILVIGFVVDSKK
ncbi:MAG: hypothetical protein ACI4P1_02460 [Erysipelotrichaceae bacterium]|nr:hypothetical protein [Erysipelotrichaceae bacterium]